MQIPHTPVALADLPAAGIHLTSEEATALVRELALRAVRGEVPGVPSAHVIRLSSDGDISVEGPVGAGGPSVVRAAQLLDSLLPGSDGANTARVPGALKLVVARGLRTLDLPPFGSLADFADALTRFAAPDPRAVVTALVERRGASVATRPGPSGHEAGGGASPQSAQVEPFAPAEPLVLRSAPPATVTISDIRRARRATGMSLAEVADRTRIPIGLLRQLEWGYLLNWPAGDQGRRLLTRYARAAGLDERLVVATVTPLIDQVTTLRALFATRPALQEARAADGDIAGDVPLESVTVMPARPPARRRRTGLRALVAVAALAVVGLLPVWWLLSPQPPDAPSWAGRGAVPPDASVQLAETDRSAIGDSGSPSEPPAAQPDRAPGPASGETDVERPAAPPAAPVSRPAEPAANPPTPPPAATAAEVPTGRDADPQPWTALPASVGTAMFHDPDDAEAPTAVGASGTGPASLLRVTRIVGDAASNSHVRPSPNGRSIAFDSDRSGERGVYVADADGQNVRRVSPPGFAAMPSWSPDSRMLAFVRADADRPDVWNLWALELDTGHLRQMTRHTAGQPRGGSWFPAGDRIVYGLEDRVVIHDLHSGQERVHASPRKGRLVRTPVVSPDGRRVVFQVQRDGAWLLDVASGSMRRLLDDPTADEYAWSPDGRQLAYHSERSGGWEVWIMAPP